MITEGIEIGLSAVGADHGCLVTTPSGHVHLSADIAGAVMVAPIADQAAWRDLIADPRKTVVAAGPGAGVGAEDNHNGGEHKPKPTDVTINPCKAFTSTLQNP